MAVQEILIYDVIGYNYWNDEGITAKNIKRQLDKAKADKSSVLVRINSPGGSVTEGTAIYNLFQEYAKNGLEIIMQVEGLSASMAAVIMLAGTKTTAAKNTMIMVHSASGGCWGNVRDMEDAIKMLRTADDGLITSIATKTGKDIETVKSTWFDYRDHWLTAQEAFDQGLIDEITDSTEEKLPDNVSNMTGEQAMAWFIQNYHAGDKKTTDSFFKRMTNTVTTALRNALPAIQPPQPIHDNDMSKITTAISALVAIAAADRKQSDYDAITAALKEEGIEAQLVMNSTVTANATALADVKAQLDTVSASLTTAQGEITRLKALEPEITGIQKTGTDNLGEDPKQEWSASDEAYKDIYGYYPGQKPKDA